MASAEETTAAAVAFLQTPQAQRGTVPKAVQEAAWNIQMTTIAMVSGGLNPSSDSPNVQIPPGVKDYWESANPVDFYFPKTKPGAIHGGNEWLGELAADDEFLKDFNSKTVADAFNLYNEHKINTKEKIVNYGNTSPRAQTTVNNRLGQVKLTDFLSGLHPVLTSAAHSYVSQRIAGAVPGEDVYQDPEVQNAIETANSINGNVPKVTGFIPTIVDSGTIQETGKKYNFNLGIPTDKKQNLIKLPGSTKTINLNAYTGTIRELSTAIMADYRVRQAEGKQSAFAYFQSYLGKEGFSVGTKASMTGADASLTRQITYMLRGYQQVVANQPQTVFMRDGKKIIQMETMFASAGSTGVWPKGSGWATDANWRTHAATISKYFDPDVGKVPVPGVSAAEQALRDQLKVTSTNEGINLYSQFYDKVNDAWGAGELPSGSPERAVFEDYAKNMHNMIMTEHRAYNPEEMLQLFKNYKDPKHPGVNAYEALFPGLEAARKLGYKVSESEYFANWKQASQMAQAAGLPTKFFDKKMFGRLTAQGLSNAEIQDRMVKGYAAVSQQGAGVINQFQKYFGIHQGDLLAYFLDPVKGAEHLKTKAAAAKAQQSPEQQAHQQKLIQQATAAQLGNFARTVGLGDIANEKGGATAMDMAALVKSGAAGQPAGTPYDLAQARQAIMMAGRNANLSKQALGNSAPGSTVSQQQMLAANMPGLETPTGETTIQAQREVQKAEQSRLAPFQKGGGYEENAKGVIGAGSARQ